MVDACPECGRSEVGECPLCTDHLGEAFGAGAAQVTGERCPACGNEAITKVRDRGTAFDPVGALEKADVGHTQNGVVYLHTDGQLD